MMFFFFLLNGLPKPPNRVWKGHNCKRKARGCIRWISFHPTKSITP